jgi:arsenical pump membrane protein
MPGRTLSSGSMQLILPHIATWVIAGLAILGVIVRPWGFSEALWAVLAAVALLVLGLISVPDAGKAVLKGTDVYLFLVGMMVLAELARHEGLFDWLAAYAVQKSGGSASRLFGMIYIVGTVVTIFLSNDATAVVLTPAVYAATRHARAQPLPYLFICAFIANAASFVLPISNPANLVVYGAHMPALGAWLAQFGLPSVLSIIVTFVGLRWLQRADLAGDIARDITVPTLSRGGRAAALGIAVTALVLLVASSLNWPLGLPTFLAGLRCGDGDSDPESPRALGHCATHLLESAAAGRRTVCPGGGSGGHRYSATADGRAAIPCGSLAAGDQLGAGLCGGPALQRGQ